MYQKAQADHHHPPPPTNWIHWLNPAVASMIIHLPSFLSSPLFSGGDGVFIFMTPFFSHCLLQIRTFLPFYHICKFSQNITKFHNRLKDSMWARLASSAWADNLSWVGTTRSEGSPNRGFWHLGGRAGLQFPTLPLWSVLDRRRAATHRLRAAASLLSSLCNGQDGQYQDGFSSRPPSCMYCCRQSRQACRQLTAVFQLPAVLREKINIKCLKYVETRWALGQGNFLVSYWLETQREMHPSGLHLCLGFSQIVSTTL
jgi:hypothetical protein